MVKIIDILQKISSDIYSELGSGHLENVYGSAMEYEFNNNNIYHIREFPVSVMYKGHKVGDKKLDFFVEDSNHGVMYVIELKTLKNITKDHHNQLAAYMRLTESSLGYIINFYGDEPTIEQAVI